MGAVWTGRPACRSWRRPAASARSSYRVTSTGPDHKREFTAVVVVMDTEYGSGIGRTKKEAEQKAADRRVRR